MSFNFNHGRRFLKLAFAALVLSTGHAAFAAPSDNTSFGRSQKEDYYPAEADLLRIILVFVEQGDGIVIQLPERFAPSFQPELVSRYSFRYAFGDW